MRELFSSARGFGLMFRGADSAFESGVTDPDSNHRTGGGLTEAARIVAAIALGLLTACSQPDRREAQPDLMTATSTWATNRVFLGEPIALDLELHLPDGAQWTLPPVDTTNALKLTGRASDRVERADTGTVHHLTLRWLPLAPGEHRVLGTNAAVVLPDGRQTSVFLPAALLRVDSVLTATSTLHGIRPPENWPGRFPAEMIVLILLATAALLVVLHILKQRRKRDASAPAEPPVPPHIKALTALRQLRKAGLIEQGDAEPFYVKLSAIVRTYLEERFSLRAPELTTEEFIRTASQSQALTAQQRSQTAEFLEHADLVKFARYRPDADAMRAMADSAEQLVRETAPRTPEGGAA